MIDCCWRIARTLDDKNSWFTNNNAHSNIMWVKQVIQLRNCLHCHLSIIISDSIISEQLTIVRTQLQLKSRFTCWAYRKKSDWRVCFQEEKSLNEVLVTITTCILLKITLVKFLNSCLNGIGETLIMVLLRNAVSSFVSPETRSCQETILTNEVESMSHACSSSLFLEQLDF